jgi:hypothetical protein
MKAKTIIIGTVSFLGFVILANVLFWLLVGAKFEPINSIYNKGLIVKLKPYAFAFVHGKYISVYDDINNTLVFRGRSHYTIYNGQSEPTINFVYNLYNAGYHKIWGTWCQAGDSPHIYEYHYNSTSYVKYKWPSWVSRNGNPGNTLPIFYGVGFYRYSLPEVNSNFSIIVRHPK